MNKSQRYRAEVLDESFFGKQVAWTATAEAFELALHTGDPEADGKEVDYQYYQRPLLARNADTWSRTDNVVTNRVEARFALCVNGERITADYWAMIPSGDTTPRYCGKFPKPIVIEPGIRPVVDPGMIKVEER